MSNKIKLLSFFEVRGTLASRDLIRSYQTLTFPEDREFELGEVFRLRGVQKPTNGQFTYLRHTLSSKGFVRERVQGRLEFWIKKELSKHYDPEKLNTYTEETFAAKFLPGLKRPLTFENKFQVRKIMRSKGLVWRMSLNYWSYKQANRSHQRHFESRVIPPKYVRIPTGSFTLADFLDLNKMKLSPQNYEWARRELRKRQIERLRGAFRYAARDENGKLPCSVRGNWELPQSEVFTTFEFQKFNNARKPTKAEWQSALEWLEHQGYIFDPKWKRWRKK